ncbi:aminotransferase class I/II-fold pyridoxal phosphate-dependent enzyme, partial [Xanthomonas campestris]
MDEAYTHFAQSTRSVGDMVVAREDEVVLRTFSKHYGMASIRLGY